MVLAEVIEDAEGDIEFPDAAQSRRQPSQAAPQLADWSLAA
jgi:hypothetical protein